MLSSTVQRPFRLNRMASDRITGLLQDGCLRLLESASGLAALDRLYQGGDWPQSPHAFCCRALEVLGVDYRVAAAELVHIPRTDPAIVVANHPFGGLDGIVAAHLLTGVRPDVRILVNYHLDRVPQLRELFISVDPYGGDQAWQRNRQPLREALRWVHNGGLLLIFPAGEVAHLSLRAHGVHEAPWHNSLGRLVKLTRAAVVPMYFSGRNSNTFQILGLLHPRLRTLLLPREFTNKRGTRVQVHIGRPIRYSRLQRLDQDTKITRYLYLHNRLLGRQRWPAAIPRQRSGGAMIVSTTPVNLLQAEIANLASSQCLAEQGDFRVYVARATQMPWLLQEIGRLRELTFRAVGEGTGRTVDLDLYDTYYEHLFIWHAGRGEVIGAYRLGRVDEIMRRYGLKGLYTHSLFRYGSSLIDQLDPCIELGRSFIRAEYQRNHASLLLLWRGIGSLLVRNPHYRCLFGPVTISGDYDPHSMHLLVDSLRLNNQCSDIRVKVKPRRPIPHHRSCLPDADLRCISDIELVSDLIAQIETDRKGVPVLIKQYLKLGGRFLEFNLDKDFNNAVDGLIVVDMKQADTRLLQQYLGRAGAVHYLRNDDYSADLCKVS